MMPSASARATRVAGPTLPSARRPWSSWKSATACWVSPAVDPVERPGVVAEHPQPLLQRPHGGAAGFPRAQDAPVGVGERGEAAPLGDAPHHRPGVGAHHPVGVEALCLLEGADRLVGEAAEDPVHRPGFVVLQVEEALQFGHVVAGHPPAQHPGAAEQGVQRSAAAAGAHGRGDLDALGGAAGPGRG